MATCHLCPDTFPDDQTLDHFRVLHPDVYADIARWPDGSVVIVDQTRTPDEFTPETQ